jgi:anaerobic selenocysteine-containing dehydrogenase
MVAEIRTMDRRVARHFIFENGKIVSRRGCHANPDVVLSFTSVRLGGRLMTPPINWREQIEAQKNFQMLLEGDERKAVWFARTILAATRVTNRAGEKQTDGSCRYTTMTNGGPLFVYVKDGRVLRTSPIVFDDGDAKSWTLRVRGQSFTPPRKATVSPHALAWKSTVYSPDRNLYPMKRVDFDPAGNRNPQNRGISDYEQISWDEALDLVAGEVRRLKSQYGASAITFNHPSHHTWGNIGYFTSALYRFANLVGHTRVLANPDSWEGWYWGATHHWGNTMRMGTGEGYGTVADLLGHAEMVVFWSSDPEATSGVYAGQEGSIRRLWLKQLGIPTV